MKKVPLSYVVINLRRDVWSDHIVAMQVYGAYTKEQAHKRAKGLRSREVNDDEKRYVHVRKIYK